MQRDDETTLRLAIDVIYERQFAIELLIAGIIRRVGADDASVLRRVLDEVTWISDREIPDALADAVIAQGGDHAGEK